MPKYYRNIIDLPLSKFIDVDVDDNIYALVISGKPTDQELREAWDEIRIQYADTLKDQDYRLFITLEKQITQIRITYRQILEAIKQLTDYYTVQFATELNKLLRSSFKFNVQLPEDYDNDLKRAYNRSKGIMIDLKLKERAHAAMVQKFSTNTKKTSREYYIGLLITLSDHVKYPIHDDIKTFEFCDRIRRLNQYFETKKLKDHGRR